MANTKVKGYNIALTVGGKSIVGTTSDTFSGGGVLKESIQKSDAGYKQFTNAGFDGSISVNAYTHNGAAASGEMGVKELLTNARDNATGTFAIAFGTTLGDPKVTGTCTFLSCTVNSDSEEFSNCTVELAVKAKPTYTTV